MPRTKTEPRILSVKLVHDIDEFPDTSHLGEYTSQWSSNAIDRKERGDMGRNEHRYFVPAMTVEESGNPDSPEQDYQRMESLNRGAWHYLYIHANAQIVVAGVIQRVTSGGLSGVESDSDRDYLKSVDAEELDSLRGILADLGFAADQIDQAFEDVE